VKKGKDGRPGVSLDWFNMLYQVLLGQEKGPRFGSFVAVYGLQNAVTMIDGKLARATSPKRRKKQAAKPKAATIPGLSGRKLNKEWGVGALHALYNKDGSWYHKLAQFPGALFDPNGYVLFETREAYENCFGLAFGTTDSVHIPSTIEQLPGYVRRR
jgi:hypothetical protein